MCICVCVYKILNLNEKKYVKKRATAKKAEATKKEAKVPFIATVTNIFFYYYDYDSI